MALQNAYYPHSIVFASPTATIAHLSSVSARHNNTVFMERGSAEAAPCFVGVSQVSPNIQAETPSIKTILDLMTATGENVVRDVSAGDVDLHYRQGVPFGIREAVASTNNIVARLSENSMLIWDQLSVRQGENASLSMQMIPKWDVGNDSIIWLGSAIPAVTTCTDLFTLGPVTLNSVILEGVESVTWDNRITLEQIASDGEKAPSYVGVKTYEPIVTISLKDVSETTATAFGGTAITSLSVHLRKKARTGIYVPEATAEHIELGTVNGVTVTGVKVIDDVSGSPGDVTLQLYLEKDLTAGLCFGIDTAALID